MVHLDIDIVSGTQASNDLLDGAIHYGPSPKQENSRNKIL